MTCLYRHSANHQLSKKHIILFWINIWRHWLWMIVLHCAVFLEKHAGAPLDFLFSVCISKIKHMHLISFSEQSIIIMIDCFSKAYCSCRKCGAYTDGAITAEAAEGNLCSVLNLCTYVELRRYTLWSGPQRPECIQYTYHFTCTKWDFVHVKWCSCNYHYQAVVY